eukprot:13092042-Ditylum_brightwellii.AAC.1
MSSPLLVPVDVGNKREDDEHCTPKLANPPPKPPTISFDEAWVKTASNCSLSGNAGRRGSKFTIAVDRRSNEDAGLPPNSG